MHGRAESFCDSSGAEKESGWRSARLREIEARLDKVLFCMR